MSNYDIAFTSRINIKYNGRVNIMNNVGVPAFALFQQNNKDINYKDVALEGILTKSPLSCAFFSIENIENLQNAIRHGVYKESNGEYIIGKQSQEELQIIMRSVFLQHSKNLPFNIKGQIYNLNNIVINDCIPTILINVRQYKGYIKDASSIAVPLARSANVSIKGSNVLQQTPF